MSTEAWGSHPLSWQSTVLGFGTGEFAGVPVIRMRDGAHDASIYSPAKWLGIFNTFYAQADYSIPASESGAGVKEGDACLEIHLRRNIPEDLRRLFIARYSFSIIAQYMDIHDLPVSHVVGLTHGRMAEFAQRQFGFKVAYPSESLPERVAGELDDLHSEGRLGRHKPNAPIRHAVAYMEKEEFLTRFL